MQFHFPTLSVLATAALFLFSLLINELIFGYLEFTRGVNWIYLPAGVRLLCLLLFGGWGAIGILLVSWITSFLYYFPEPEQFLRPFGGGIISAFAPYLIYKLAQFRFGLTASLSNLTSNRLLGCIFAYAFAGSFLHHVFFFALGTDENILISFFAMFIGDLTGTLLVVYIFKAFLVWWKPN